MSLRHPVRNATSRSPFFSNTSLPNHKLRRYQSNFILYSSTLSILILICYAVQRRILPSFPSDERRLTNWWGVNPFAHSILLHCPFWFLCATSCNVAFSLLLQQILNDSQTNQVSIYFRIPSSPWSILMLIRYAMQRRILPSSPLDHYPPTNLTDSLTPSTTHPLTYPPTHPLTDH